MSGRVPQTKSTPLVCSGHTRPIPSLSFSELQPDGQYFILSSCKDGKPMLRDWQGDWVGTFIGHKGAVWSAKLSGDSGVAATGSADFSAKVWDTHTGNALHTFQHAHIVRAVDLTPSSSHLLTGGMEKMLRRFDLSRPDAAADVFVSSPSGTAHDGAIKSVIWDDKRSLLISAGEDSRIRWWDPRLPSDASMVASLDFPEGVASVERGFREDDWLSISTGKKAVFLDMVKGAKGEAVPVWEKSMGYSVATCALKPGTKDKVVAAGVGDGWVRLYDTELGDLREENKGHHGPVHSISFSPDGELYASGSEDGTIRLWQTAPKNYGLWRYESNGA